MAWGKAHKGHKACRWWENESDLERHRAMLFFNREGGVREEEEGMAEVCLRGGRWFTLTSTSTPTPCPWRRGDRDRE